MARSKAEQLRTEAILEFDREPPQNDPWWSRGDARTRDGSIWLGEAVTWINADGRAVSGVVMKIDARDGALWEGSKSDALTVRSLQRNVTSIIGQHNVLAIDGRRIGATPIRYKKRR